MAQFFILRDEERRNNALEFIRALNLKKAHSVEIKEYRANRSHAQNRLYWSWVNIIARDTGHEAEDLHEMFKKRFLGTVEKVILGQVVQVSRSTATLTTQEFTHLLEMVEQLAETMGIRLPHPDDYRYCMGAVA